MPLKETMGLSHRENACETCVALIRFIRARDSRRRCVASGYYEAVRVVAGMTCEHESGMKGSANSLNRPVIGRAASCRIMNERAPGEDGSSRKVRHGRGRRSSDLLYQ